MMINEKLGLGKKKKENNTKSVSLVMSPEQKKILRTKGNLLVLGGPGSGKTTVAILKARQLAKYRLLPEQKILFLSFSRSAVSRIQESAKEHFPVSAELKERVEINTYHAFFWKIVKTHGYLLGLPRSLSVMLPPEEAVALATIRNDYPAPGKLSKVQKKEKSSREEEERTRLAYKDGKVCFDLFARLAGELLRGSKKIRRLVSSVFPAVMLDEFQDTSKEQWAVVKRMGRNSRLIALADPEQRIFEFAGADPERLDHYRKFAKPREVDLGGANYRSADTDILKFGDDVLRDKLRDSPYRGIDIKSFPPNPNQAMSALRYQTLQARKRLLDGNGNDWSLAILVPTKKMTRQISEVFGDGKSEIPHYAVVDMEASILAAGVLAFLLQPEALEGDFPEFVKLLADYFLGKGGGAPAKTDIEEAQRIRKSLKEKIEREKSGKPPRKNSIIIGISEGYKKCRNLEFIGNPDEDWKSVRKILEETECGRLQEVAKDTRNVRLLGRGTQFREALSQAWRDTGSYTEAFGIAERSFVQENFITSNRPERGVVIMNMHKAKGKQFDEVIIFEGWPHRKGNFTANPDRIVLGNKRRKNLNSFRQNFRVSVTRARNRTTIMTPKGDPCILLSPPPSECN